MKTLVILSQIQSIIAAADSLAQASGSYKGANLGDTTLAPLLPNQALTTPWGSTIAISEADETTYKVSIPNMPVGVCPIVISQLKANNHFSVTTDACSASGPTDFSYTYSSSGYGKKS